MNKSEYLKLVEEASNKKMKITKQMEKEIRDVYREVARDLEKKLAKANPNSLNERWLYDYKKSLEREIDSITKSLYKSNKQKIEQVIKATNDPQLSLFQSINSKYDLGLESTFNSMFSRVNKEVLNEILLGKIYKDNRGLSDRLWIDSRHMKKDIQSVVLEGIAGKKSAYDMAKDLRAHVDPDNKTTKQINYNATRLARTSINHSYQLALKRSSTNNPFVTGLQWHSALSHRSCEICKERHGKIYTSEEIELDHPNGLCTNIPIIPMSFEEIGSELKSWVDGEQTEYTDGINSWMKVNSFDFDGDKNKGGNGRNKGYNSDKETEIKLSNDSDYQDSFFGKFGDEEVRKWYKAHDTNIPNLLNELESLENQARQASDLRNKYRTEARDMMKDQETRKWLDLTKPNLPFEYYFKKYSKPKEDGNIPTIDEVYNMIINKSTTTNKEFDKKAGVDNEN